MKEGPARFDRSAPSRYVEDVGVGRAVAGVLSVVLALGAAACHRRPLQPADVGIADAETDADGETDAALSCGEVVSDDPGFTVEGLVSAPGAAAVGQALVEESTSTSLVLALIDGAFPGSPPPRLTLHGAPAPTLPVGRIAWLAYAVSNGDTFGLQPSSWLLVVSDVEGGTILFGTAHEHPGELLTPFPIGATTSLCSFGDCPRTTELALAVPGASPATIPSGGTATVPIGKNRYQLWVHAEAQTFAGDQADARCDAATFAPPLPLVLTYVAKDLAGLAAGLAMPAQP